MPKQLLSLLMWVALVNPALAASAEPAPLKVLYVTSAGWYHDYQAQIEPISEALGKYAELQFDLRVGDIEVLKQPGFGHGYDVLIYNFCHAARRDTQLIDNLINAVQGEGIPLLALHCTMHSFQQMDDWYDFLGMKTLRHERQRSLIVRRVGNHPVLTGLPGEFSLERDELYLNIELADDIQPLLTAYGVESNRTHVVAWSKPVGATRLIGVTLGHSDASLQNRHLQRFLAGAVLYLGGRSPVTDPCDEGCGATIGMLTEQARYPTDAERNCVFREIRKATEKQYSACVKQCKRDDEVPRETCKPRCRADTRGPTPESVWPECMPDE